MRARAVWPEPGWEANPLRTANLQEQPGRTPVLVLGASGGQAGKTAARRLAVAGAQRAAGETTNQGRTGPGHARGG